MPRAKNTGAWLSVRGNKVSGTALLATKFSDLLCTSYNVNPPQPPEPLQWIWHRLWFTSCTYLQQRRPGNCASQQSAWRTPLLRPAGLHLIISTLQTPNTSGPYQIRKVDPSGERQIQRDAGRCDDTRFMESIGWRHHWHQTQRRWRGFLQIWANGGAPSSVGNNQEGQEQ